MPVDHIGTQYWLISPQFEDIDRVSVKKQDFGRNSPNNIPVERLKSGFD